MTNKQYFVSPHANKGRKVTSPGAKRDILHTTNQNEAIAQARKIAQNNSAELKIQGRNGQIRQSNSYGSDPFPPKR